MKKVGLWERLTKAIFPHWFDENGDRVDFNKDSQNSKYSDNSERVLRSYLQENDLIDATNQLINLFKVDDSIVREYIIHNIQNDKEQKFFRVTDVIGADIKTANLIDDEYFTNRTQSKTVRTSSLSFFEVHFNLFNLCMDLNIKPNHELYYLIAAMLNEFTLDFSKKYQNQDIIKFEPKYKFAKMNESFHIYFSSEYGFYAKEILIEFQEQFYLYFAYGRGSKKLTTQHIDSVTLPIANYRDNDSTLVKLQNQLLSLSNISYQLKAEFSHFYDKMSLTYFDSINNVGYILSEEYKDIKQFSEENLELSTTIVEKIYKVIKEQLERLQSEKIKYQKDMEEASITSRRKILEMELEVLEKGATGAINQSEIIANIIKEDLKTS